jgi:hypothetical protein
VQATLGQIPTRLIAKQTGKVLNCQVHDMPIMVRARLLKPLENLPRNGIKFFAALEVLFGFALTTFVLEISGECQALGCLTFTRESFWLPSWDSMPGILRSLPTAHDHPIIKLKSCIQETRVRFPSPAPTSIPTNEFNVILHFHIFEKSKVRIKVRIAD